MITKTASPKNKRDPKIIFLDFYFNINQIFSEDTTIYLLKN